MLKLNLLIADSDQAYVERLTTYLNNNDSHRFSISYVTSKEAMVTYLNKRSNNLDIALVHPSMSKEISVAHNVTTILLTDGRINILDKDKHVMSKFLRGDLIASQLIEVYTREHPEHMYLNKSNRKLKTIAVFSPLGGVGKSLISAGCAMVAQKMGKEVFYLNLEDGCSTSCYFDGEGFSSISELIYYLKNKKEQLHIKIEAIAFRDAVSGVKSFAPPESLMDIAELSTEEIEELITNVMNSNHELLFIDLSNQLSQKNMKALELADEILLIGSPTNTGSRRMNQFLKHMSVLEKRKGLSFMSKIHFVYNSNLQNSSAMSEVDNHYFNEFKSAYNIIFDQVINDHQGVGVPMHSDFAKDLQSIVQVCMNEDR